MKFIYHKPAILHKNALIIGDTHFGIEERLRTKGISYNKISEQLTEKIIETIKQTRAKKLIILGDIKDKIGVMDKITERCLEKLSEHAELILVMGNHDGGLEFEHAKIVQTEGFVYEKLGLAHGHAWPEEELMNADYLINAHQHPIIRLKDRSGKTRTERVWIIAPPDKQKIKEHYKTFNENIQLIIMPAFNPLVGSEITNETMGPLLNNKLFKLISSNIYTLDGLFLGKVLSGSD